VWDASIAGPLEVLDSVAPAAGTPEDIAS
jgi:hypothetical protein